MARARSHGTFSEFLSVTAGTGEEEGREDEVGHRPERAEQGDRQGQLPPPKYTGYLAQSARG